MKIGMQLILVVCMALSLSLFAHDKDAPGKGMMAGEHFKKMDTDGDKKISKEEWQKFHDGMFQEMDKDADGSISFDELKEKRMDQKDKMKEKAKENKKQGKKKNQAIDTE